MRTQYHYIPFNNIRDADKLDGDAIYDRTGKPLGLAGWIICAQNTEDLDLVTRTELERGLTAHRLTRRQAEALLGRTAIKHAKDAADKRHDERNCGSQPLPR